MNMMKAIGGYGHYGNAAAHRKFGEAALTIDELRAVAPSVFAEHAHESRSERYGYIPTSAVVDALMKEGFQPFTVKQGKSRIEGKENFTKHLIRFRHQSLADVKSGDSVLEIGLLNSHDGTSSWEIMGALWRVCCLNALVSGGEMLISRKVPHTIKKVTEVVDATYTVLEESKRLTTVPDDWSGITLNHGEAHAFAKAAHALRFDDEGTQGKVITPTQLLARRRQEDCGMTLWQTFNAVQENAIKGGLEGVVTRTDEAGNEVRRAVTTREVKAIDDNVKLNRALWVLAEEMAKYKA